MTPTVFGAVLGAALLHAVWNAMVKGGGDRRMAMAAVVIGAVPFALACLPFVPAPDPASLPLLALTIGLHLSYQLFLLAAYEAGDFTQVYPIARGSAPLLVAAVSVAFLGITLAPTEIAAISVIAAGILSIALGRRGDGLRNGRAATYALATGGFIAAYSIVDGTGARLAGTSLGYYSWAAIANGALMAALLAVRDRPALRRAVTRGAWVGLGGGGASFASYAIVTWAFTQAPIALVAALRETSIVFAIIIGATVLRERLNLVKVAAVALTLLGAVMLRWAQR